MSNKAIGVSDCTGFTTATKQRGMGAGTTPTRSELIALVSQVPYKTVIFKEFANAPASKKFLSLFPGLGYAAGYKILQRVYKCVWRAEDSPRRELILLFAQVRRTALLQRHHLEELQDAVQLGFRREEWQGHHVGDGWIVSSPVLLVNSQVSSPKPINSLTGIGEIVLLPLDVLKIKRQ